MYVRKVHLRLRRLVTGRMKYTYFCNILMGFATPCRQLRPTCR